MSVKYPLDRERGKVLVLMGVHTNQAFNILTEKGSDFNIGLIKAKIQHYFLKYN